MKFLRQRVAGTLLVIGLVFAWVCLTSVAIRQSIQLSGQASTYTATALKNPSVRSAVSDLIVTSAKTSNPVLAQIPANILKSAVDKGLTEPLVVGELGNAATQIQQHVIGLNSGPIVIGGPDLSSAVAEIVAPNNFAEKKLIESAPFSVTIASSSIPSFGRYYRWLDSTLKFSLYASAALLAASLILSAKKNRTLRKIGLWFVGFSLFNGALFWLLPKYLLSHLQNSPGRITAGVLAASSAAVEPIYIVALGAGTLLTIISFLL